MDGPLTGIHLENEIEAAATIAPREIDHLENGRRYDREVALGNTHTWRRDAETGLWCRFSRPSNCGTAITNWRGVAARRVRRARAVDARTVRDLEVGAYSDLQSREVRGDRLEHDHIPSFAAVLERINRQRRAHGERVLTARQEARLRSRLTCVEVDAEIHAGSRTWRGRNTAAQIDSDSSDLRAAARADAARMREHLDAAGYSSDVVDAAIRRLHARNRELGVYDAELPDALFLPTDE